MAAAARHGTHTLRTLSQTQSRTSTQGLVAKLLVVPRPPTSTSPQASPEATAPGSPPANAVADVTQNQPPLCLSRAVASVSGGQRGLGLDVGSADTAR